MGLAFVLNFIFCKCFKFDSLKFVFWESVKRRVIIYCCYLINSLPHDKFLDWSKFKAFADDNINSKERLKIILGRVENIVRTGENASYQHFLLFPQSFQKPSLPWSVKVGIVWYGVNAELLYLNGFVWCLKPFKNLFIMAAMTLVNAFSPAWESSISKAPDSRPRSCRFDTHLQQTFFLAIFHLSSLMHVRKVVRGFGKKTVIFADEDLKKEIWVVSVFMKYSVGLSNMRSWVWFPQTGVNIGTFHMAHAFGASTGVVSRMQKWKRFVEVVKSCFSINVNKLV